MGIFQKLRLWRALGAFLNTRFGAYSAGLFQGLVNKSAASISGRNLDETPPWAPFSKPLSQCKVAVVTTSGVYADGDEPFDVDDPKGDASFRVIPSGIDIKNVKIAHAHFSHLRANQDMNVLFPLDRLREAVEAGAIGSLAPSFFSFGFGAGLTKEYIDPQTGTAHQIAKQILAENADFVLMVPA